MYSAVPMIFESLPKVRRRAPAFAGDPKIDELDLIFAADHDVFGLEIPMDHSVGVNIVGGVAQSQGHPNGTRRVDFACLGENVAQ